MSTGSHRPPGRPAPCLGPEPRLTPEAFPALFSAALRTLDPKGRFDTLDQAMGHPVFGLCLRGVALNLYRQQRLQQVARAGRFDARRAAANDLTDDTETTC